MSSAYLNRRLRSLSEVMPRWEISWRQGDDYDCATVSAMTADDALDQLAIPLHAQCSVRVRRVEQEAREIAA